jgi:hypothetical protein
MASKLLLGHESPVSWAIAGRHPEDRPTGHSEGTFLGRRMDGSGRSEASPAIAYSLFTANGSVAEGRSVLDSRGFGHQVVTLRREAFSWKPFVPERGRVRPSPHSAKRGDRGAHPTNHDDTVLAPFAPLFSERVLEHVRVLLARAILASGRRTVSSALRAMGLDQHRRFHRYHRVGRRASAPCGALA